MTQEIAIQQKREMILVVSDIVPDNIMHSWAVWNEKRFQFIKDSEIRKTKYDFLFSELTNESTEQEIQTALDSAKKLFQETQDERTGATDPLDKAKAKLMDFEKSMQPIASGVKADKVNGEYAKWDQRRITLALDREQKEKDAESLRKEKIAFTAHFENEYVRLLAAYKQSLRDLLDKEYIGALKAKMNADALPEYITQVKKVLSEVKVGSMTKFTRTLIQDSDAPVLFAEVNAPDYSVELQSSFSDVDDRFSTYLTDVANAAAVEAETIRKAQEQKTAQEQATQATMAVNTLVANATSAVSVVSTCKEIKRKEVIVMENTQEYAVIVVSEFLKNISVVGSSLRVKEWGNLTVTQMAAALSTMDTKINGLKYQEVLK